METKNIIRAWINWKSSIIGDTYTQDRLSKDSGVWPSELTKYLQGRREPSKKTIDRLANAFGISVSEFWGGPEEYERKRRQDAEDTAFLRPVSYIKLWRRHANLSIEELAEKAGVTLQDMRDFETGKFVSGSATVNERIADALGITVEKLAHGPELDDLQPGDQIPGVATMMGRYDLSKRIPLLTSIPAGDWKEWVDQYPPGISEETVARLDVKGEHVVALRVDGDSMIGEGLRQGDILIADPEKPFEVPRGGRIGVVKYNGSYKIRRVYIADDGVHYRLVPANQLYHEERVPISETTVYMVVDWRPNKEGMF